MLAESGWAFLSWWLLIQPLQVKYPPRLLRLPLQSSRRVSGLAWWVHDADKCWLRTWSGPSPQSQSHWRWRMQTLPKHSAKRGFGALDYWRRSSWSRMAARAFLSMRPSIVEALWKPDLQGNWTEGYSQYSTIGHRHSKCDIIMLHIWQPYLRYSTLSTAS